MGGLLPGARGRGRLQEPRRAASSLTGPHPPGSPPAPAAGEDQSPRTTRGAAAPPYRRSRRSWRGRAHPSFGRRASTTGRADPVPQRLVYRARAAVDLAVDPVRGVGVVALAPDDDRGSLSCEGYRSVCHRTSPALFIPISDKPPAAAFGPICLSRSAYLNCRNSIRYDGPHQLSKRPQVGNRGLTGPPAKPGILCIGTGRPSGSCVVSGQHE